MASNSAVTPHSILEKFEFYLLGLTFTLLGASIQTANLADRSSASVIAEILGWAGFGLSGLIGLSKLKHLSVVIYLRNRKSELEEHKGSLDQGKASGITQVRIAQTGEVMTVDAAIQQVNGNLSLHSEHLDKAGKRHEVKAIIQNWSFVLGLLSVAVARAYDAIAQIIYGQPQFP